ncbi:MAG: hypothetical protein COB02_04730 [Candidatus Cloacimonadota bacterium]|nr:MAG: hypothetical protein COB02_04730 [Candidatus Cloacimonadota bacterium]
MEEIKTKKLIKKKSNNSFLIILNSLILIGIVVLLLKQDVQKEIKEVEIYSYIELKEAALNLKSKGFVLESADLFHRYYQTINNKDEKIKILNQLVELYGFDYLKQKLKALSLLESLDPDEKFSLYKKTTYETLKLLAKDKDAELYLQSATSMVKTQTNSGSKNIVIASILGEEVYYHELETFQKDFSSQTNKKELMTQLLAKKLLQKESEPLIQNEDFKKIASKSLLDLRISFLMNQEMSKLKASDFDLKNYYQANLYKYVFSKGYLISHLLIKDDEPLQKLLKAPPNSLSDFESFVDLYSIDLNKKTKGKISKWIEKDFIPLIGKVKGLTNFLDGQSLNTLTKALKSKKGTHFFWIHQKRQGQNKKYEDVKEIVKKSYRAENQQKFQEQYFKDLFAKYKVVLHEDRL